MLDPGGVGLVTDLSAAWIAALLDVCLKGTVLLVLAVLAARLLDGASAAARHLVWATALVGMLALPVLRPVTPGLEVPLLPRLELAAPEPTPAAAPTHGPPGPAAAAPGSSTPAAGTGQTVGVRGPATGAQRSSAAGSAAGPGDPAALGASWLARADPRLLAGGVWLLGTLFVLATLLVGKARIRWLARDADRVRDGPWAELRDRIADRLELEGEVVLLRGRRPLVPMTWGVLRPRVMLPETADTWPDACRRNVLLHELAHVKRRDCLVQLLARLACAVYWFHPLVWHAARQLRLEQEEACDDHVLRAGTLASDYARQLVGMARLLRAVRTPAHAGSTGMGRSDFMKRMRALLEGGRSRRPVSRRAAAALASAAGLLVLALASVRPAAPGAADDVAADTVDATDGSTIPGGGPEFRGLELIALDVGPPEAAGGWPSPVGPPPTGDRRPGPGASGTGPDGDGARHAEGDAVDDLSTRDPGRADADVPAVAPDRRRQPTDGVDADGARGAGDRRGGDRVPTAARRDAGEEHVERLREAFAAYWHGGGAGSPTGGAGASSSAGGFGSVTVAARELARRLDGLEDAAAREALLRRNAGTGSTRSLAVLMELSFLAERPADRVTAVRTLAHAPSGARGRFLYQVARANPWAEVRAAAARQLRKLGPDRVVPWLVTLAYEDTDPAVQRRVVTELARLDRSGVDASLMQIARSHPEREVRLEAIIWLLKTGSGQALSKYVENA